VAESGMLGDDHAIWRKSTASGGSECVEVALVGPFVLVRQSERPAEPPLAFSRAQWAAFLIGARNGEFDLDSLPIHRANLDL
jgi:hypothetical protein